MEARPAAAAGVRRHSLSASSFVVGLQRSSEPTPRAPRNAGWSAPRAPPGQPGHLRADCRTDAGVDEGAPLAGGRDPCRSAPARPDGRAPLRHVAPSIVHPSSSRQPAWYSGCVACHARIHGTFHATGPGQVHGGVDSSADGGRPRGASAPGLRRARTRRRPVDRRRGARDAWRRRPRAQVRGLAGDGAALAPAACLPASGAKYETPGGRARVLDLPPWWRTPAGAPSILKSEAADHSDHRWLCEFRVSPETTPLLEWSVERCWLPRRRRLAGARRRCRHGHLSRGSGPASPPSRAPHG